MLLDLKPPLACPAGVLLFFESEEPLIFDREGEIALHIKLKSR